MNFTRLGTLFKWNHRIPLVLLWPACFTQNNVFKVHLCCTMYLNFLSPWGYKIPHCIAFAYPFIHQWTFGLLPHLCYGEWCCYEHGYTNISSRPCFNPLRYTSRSGIAGWYGNSMLSFLRNCHTVLHSVYTISYSHPELHKFQILHKAIQYPIV